MSYTNQIIRDIADVETLRAERNAVLAEMSKVSPSWQPNRLRALQVEASRLASEIGRRSAQ